MILLTTFKIFFIAVVIRGARVVSLVQSYLILVYFMEIYDIKGET